MVNLPNIEKTHEKKCNYFTKFRKIAAIIIYTIIGVIA